MHFKAMGSQCEVLVVGGPSHLAEEARRRIDDLEQRWSRFIPSSEICFLNENNGRLQTVSSDTFLLLQYMLMGWEETKGRFDPTILDALRACGYRQSFSPDNPQLVMGGESDHNESAKSKGCGGILLDPVNQTVLLPLGVHIDPGGIGKGLAADLVVSELLAAGAQGAMVNLGGDIRAAGDSGVNAGWVISVEDPFVPDLELLRVAIGDGAVATSSRLRRTWRNGSETRHHLIDPASQSSSQSGLAAVTVIAREAWLAEVLTKAAFIAGSSEGHKVIINAGVTGALVHDGGSRQDIEGLEELLV